MRLLRPVFLGVLLGLTTGRAESTNDWTLYSRDRLTKVLLDGQLVEKSKLTALTGFLVRKSAEVTINTRTVRGATLEIAKRRDDDGKAASLMELRPSFWAGTGEMVWLAGYTPDVFAGDLLRVLVVEVEPIDSHRVFKVGTELTFEQWKLLRRR